MLKGMSRKELSQLPPFPFPKELFPPGRPKKKAEEINIVFCGCTVLCECL